jgi:predicted amino acid racemase
VGNLDTTIKGLTPLVADYQIAGASSDITVVNLASNPNKLEVGDTVTFKTNYAAFLGLMNDPYIPKEVFPPLEQFETSLPGKWNVEVPKTIEDEPSQIC